MTFAETFKRLREDAQLTQMEMARILNVSQATIGMYERGDRMPSAKMESKIANYFGVSLETLRGLAPYAPSATAARYDVLLSNPSIQILLDVCRNCSDNEISIATDFLNRLRRYREELTKEK